MVYAILYCAICCYIYFDERLPVPCCWWHLFIIRTPIARYYDYVDWWWFVVDSKRHLFIVEYLFVVIWLLPCILIEQYLFSYLLLILNERNTWPLFWYYVDLTIITDLLPGEAHYAFIRWWYATWHCAVTFAGDLPLTLCGICAMIVTILGVFCWFIHWCSTLIVSAIYCCYTVLLFVTIVVDYSPPPGLWYQYFRRRLYCYSIQWWLFVSVYSALFVTVGIIVLIICCWLIVAVLSGYVGRWATRCWL